MRILYIINNLGSGGAEKLIEEVVPLMNDMNDIEVEILLLTDKNNVFDAALKRQGVKIHVIKLKNIYSPLNIFQISKFINESNYDIVHVHLFPAQYWVGIARLFVTSKNIKFVTTEHSTNNRRRSKAYFRIIDEFIYSRYDSIISITDKTQAKLIEWINPKKDEELKKYKVIENGINLDKFINAVPYNKLELSKKFTEKSKLICMVGRFAEAKDQDTLIRSMAKLAPEINLLLVGEGPLKEKSKLLAEKLGVDDRVHFLGFRNDIERILKTSDIVVLSSHWEGLSLASIEGMSCGKPFIASKVDGLVEIVDGYGLIFQEGNEEEFISLVKGILSNNCAYNEIASKCLNRAKGYDIKNMIIKLIDEYNRLQN